MHLLSNTADGSEEMSCMMHREKGLQMKHLPVPVFCSIKAAVQHAVEVFSFCENYSKETETGPKALIHFTMFLSDTRCFPQPTVFLLIK